MEVRAEFGEELEDILLRDRTTGRNILWATDTYAAYGAAYSADAEISVQTRHVIRPRTARGTAEQQKRVRDKAEVFTPSWICKEMNDLVDSDRDNMNWREYAARTVLEITCGEAPYLTSRYDAVTGEPIAVKDRIGLLDRKLRVVGENTETREDWLAWATVAAQSIYGFEWQGDNLLIARENVLLDVIEHFTEKFGATDADCEIPRERLERFAEIISWNLWQMDGLKFVVPNSCCTETKTEETLFETIVISKPCEGCRTGDNTKHNGIYCMVMDWNTNQKLRFVDMLGGNVK